MLQRDSVLDVGVGLWLDGAVSEEVLEEVAAAVVVVVQVSDRPQRGSRAHALVEAPDPAPALLGVVAVVWAVEVE